MKINAAQRLLTAGNESALLRFLEQLSPESLEYFYRMLPASIRDWLDNDSAMKPSKHLPMHFASAAAYTKGDALAVALGHLKAIYPPKVTRPIYRSMLRKSSEPLPTTKVVNFRSSKRWKPLQSWTYKETPIVMDRSFSKKTQYDIVLCMEPQQSKSVVVTDYLQLTALAKDAIALAPKLQRSGIKVDDLRWKYALRMLRDFAEEEEVLVYIPFGHSVKCTWRVVAGTVGEQK